MYDMIFTLHMTSDVRLTPRVLLPYQNQKINTWRLDGERQFPPTVSQADINSVPGNISPLS